jgi:hypothetical protein
MDARGFADVAGRRLASTLNVPLFCQQCGGNTLSIESVNLLNMFPGPGQIDARASGCVGSLGCDELVTDGLTASVILACRECPPALGTGLAGEIHAEEGVMRVIVREDAYAPKDH